MEQVKRHSLSQQATEILKEKIVSAHFKYGEQLRVEVLAENLQISRTPVRDALKALIEQGLVINNGIHYEVYTPTIADLENLFSIRGCLESFAVKRVVEKISPKKERELQELLDRGRLLLDLNKEDEFLEYDKFLHDWIIQTADNSKLENIIKLIHDQCWLIRNNFFKTYHPGSENIAMEEHLVIIKFMLDKNSDAAGKAMEEHLLNSVQRIKAVFNVTQ